MRVDRIPLNGFQIYPLNFAGIVDRQRIQENTLHERIGLHAKLVYMIFLLQAGLKKIFTDIKKCTKFYSGFKK